MTDRDPADEFADEPATEVREPPPELLDDLTFDVDLVADEPSGPAEPPTPPIAPAAPLRALEAPEPITEPTTAPHLRCPWCGGEVLLGGEHAPTLAAMLRVTAVEIAREGKAHCYRSPELPDGRWWFYCSQNPDRPERLKVWGPGGVRVRAPVE
jgi:hypothetical protein